MINPTIIIVFGATGDLTKRKLAPALYKLFTRRLSPQKFEVIGIGRTQFDDESFREHLRSNIPVPDSNTDDNTWRLFSNCIGYLNLNFLADDSYGKLKSKISQIQNAWGTIANCIYYLAVSPTFISPIVQSLGKNGLFKDPKHSRIVLEKPFGRDLNSAKSLSNLLATELKESQIFRIDHYLGKDSVQNILAFRFGNSLFEPIWDRKYIDNIQITVAEELGVEHRGSYYDHTGALRDMVENHLLQILSCIAMEAPASSDADEIRNKKIDLLKTIRPIAKADVPFFTARGQYGKGEVCSKIVPAYREESGVSGTSNTETYAALKLYIDNWRWNGVPFYLRTGKRLPEHAAYVCVQFKDISHNIFLRGNSSHIDPNMIYIDIQPSAGIAIKFQVKEPGHSRKLLTQDLKFSYDEAFEMPIPTAYETLLMDCIKGDPTLFVRADREEFSWRIITPLLDVWEKNRPSDYPNYAAGSWGPKSAEALLERDGRKWSLPYPAKEESVL